ncbi:187-kDa microtubule-associated protein AIR9 isoform X1 [Tanacetum coccineum]
MEDASPECAMSFPSSLAASGAITSGLRMITKGVFDSSQNGLRKGATRSVLILLFDYLWYTDNNIDGHVKPFNSSYATITQCCLLYLHALIEGKLVDEGLLLKAGNNSFNIKRARNDGYCAPAKRSPLTRGKCLKYMKALYHGLPMEYITISKLQSKLGGEANQNNKWLDSGANKSGDNLISGFLEILAGYLTDQLLKIQVVNDVNKDFVIEALRSIAVLITYGDQHDTNFFEYGKRVVQSDLTKKKLAKVEKVLDMDVMEDANMTLNKPNVFENQRDIDAQFVYLRDNLLSSLEGIKILKLVKVLNLSFNDFKGPRFKPLEACKALQQFYLAGNQITSFTTLPKLPNLEYLSVAQNKLKLSFNDKSLTITGFVPKVTKTKGLPKGFPTGTILAPKVSHMDDPCTFLES